MFRAMRTLSDRFTISCVTRNMVISTVNRSQVGMFANVFLSTPAAFISSKVLRAIWPHRVCTILTLSDDKRSARHLGISAPTTEAISIARNQLSSSNGRSFS
jgi:hypothetical protein